MKPDSPLTMKTTAAHNGLVLLYHSVGPAALPDSIHHVDTKVLDQHLSEVGRFFTFVSLEEYANRKDRAGLCAVTFDDGYRNVMELSLIHI